MSYEFTKLTEVPALETLTDNAHLIVEDGGKTRRFPVNQVGKVKTVNNVEPDAEGNIEIEIPEGFSGSWNDLTDKPFGEVSAYTPCNATFAYQADLNIWVANDNVGFFTVCDSMRGKVVWDGTEYEGTFYVTADNIEYTAPFESIWEIPAAAIGLVFKPNANGAPFTYEINYDVQNDTQRACISADDKTAEHTFEIYIFAHIVNRLPEKFMPVLTDASTGIQYKLVVASGRVAIMQVST